MPQSTDQFTGQAAYHQQAIAPLSLLKMACNVLHKYCLDAPRIDAKRVFQDMTVGERPLIKLTMDDQSQLLVRGTILLDEFQGDKLNFSTFRRHLQTLLAHIARQVELDKDIPTFNDDSGKRLIFHTPIVIQDGMQGESGAKRPVLNALVLSVDLRVAAEATLEMMYLDPQQFEKPSEQSA